MKTCRFCMNKQESGDRCDACGSPFSADKLDFSEGLPEVDSAFPDPTASSMPDPTLSPVPVAAAVPAVEPAPEKKDGPAPSAEEAPEEPKRIMYSAAIAGETVYLKSKGNFRSKSTGESVAGHFMPASAVDAISQKRLEKASTETYSPDEAAPVPVVVNPVASTPKAPFKYNGLLTHSLVTFILSCVGLLCCCGMSTPSLVMSLIAYLTLRPVKLGTVNGDAESVAGRAKVLTIISDVWLVVSAFIMLLIIII